MAFSFSNWFKKPSGQEDAPPTATVSAEAPAAVAAAPAARYPSAPSAPAQGNPPQPPRTLKTVVPNSVRPVSLREGMTRPGVNPVVPPSAVSVRPGPSAVPPGTRSIGFPGMVPVAPAVAPVAPKAAAVPPPTFHAAPDAPVVIPLGEFFDRIPTNLLQAGANVDRAREVTFRAADLYSDLARGRASVPASAVQAACPDLFGRTVSATEDVEITLPLQRVIEQLADTFQPRPDQVAEDDVAEVETPFLQVALEDSVRLPKPPAPTASPAAVRPVAPAVRPVAPAPPAPPAASLPAVVPPPARIAGNEVSTIRALTPRQFPTTPHAPAQAPDLPPAPPVDRDPAMPINPVAKRPPTTVRASVAGGKIRLSGPAISSRSIAPAAANSALPSLVPSAPPATHKPTVAAVAASMAPAQKKTARIQIPPIALRPVGSAPSASAGAPRPGSPARAVPFPEPLVSFRAAPGDPIGATPAPAAMPPPLATPSSGVTRPLPHANISLRPAGGPPPAYLTAPPPMMPFAPVAAAPASPAAPVEAPAAAAAEEDGSTIGFALAPILRTLPEGMFTAGLDGYGAAEQVPDGARVELPLGFITAQLAQGRVAVPRAMFVTAMPAACRHLMLAEGEPAEVVIPLQEVFQSLPTGALNRRRDQVVDEVGPEIPTPFSQKAQEDAQRLAPAADPEPTEETVPPEPEPMPEALAVPVELEPPAVVEPEPEPEPEPVTAEAPAPVAAVQPPEPEPAAEAPAPEPEPVAEAPAVLKEEEKEPAPEPVTAHAGELSPMEAVAEPEPEPEAAATAAPEPAEEMPAVTETVAPVVVEAVEHPETPADPVPPEEAPAAPPVEPPTAELTPIPEETPAVADAPETPPPVQDLAPAPEEVHDEPERLPVPALPAANGQHTHVPMAALTPVPAASPEEIQDTLRAIFMVDEELDAKKIVRLAASLPGLKACAVMFGDGLKLAGDLADGLSVSEGFCAMTPPFFRRARAYAAELSLGETQCVSLQTERALLSFFMAGNVCLSVQHAANRPFLPGVREKLLAATTEMARMYATPPAR